MKHPLDRKANPTADDTRRMQHNSDKLSAYSEPPREEDHTPHAADASHEWKKYCDARLTHFSMMG